MTLLGQLVSVDDALATMLGYASADDLMAARGELPLLKTSCLIELMEEYLVHGTIIGLDAELPHAREGTVEVALDGRLVTMESGRTVIELRIDGSPSSRANTP